MKHIAAILLVAIAVSAINAYSSVRKYKTVKLTKQATQLITATIVTNQAHHIQVISTINCIHTIQQTDSIGHNWTNVIIYQEPSVTNLIPVTGSTGFLRDHLTWSNHVEDIYYTNFVN